MTKCVILAVNDPNILYLLRRYAEESGLQTVSASRCQDVLALLAQQTDPALIVLDSDMSGASARKKWHGLEVEAASRNIPVVIYSYLDEPGDDWQGGAVRCLPNSVMYDDFVAALKSAGVSLEPAFS